MDSEYQWHCGFEDKSRLPKIFFLGIQVFMKKNISILILVFLASISISANELTQAIRNGEKNKVIDLIFQCRNLDEADLNGETPLILMVNRGWNDVLRTLLILRPSLDLTDVNGFTALMLAAGAGNAGMVEALVNAGANPLLVNVLGQTARMLGGHNREINGILTQAEAIQNRIVQAGAATQDTALTGTAVVQQEPEPNGALATAGVRTTQAGAGAAAVAHDVRIAPPRQQPTAEVVNAAMAALVGIVVPTNDPAVAGMVVPPQNITAPVLARQEGTAAAPNGYARLVDAGMLGRSASQ